MKQSLLILNCCPLGKNEVEFWNAVFDQNRDNYFFHFITTTVDEELRADELVQIDYEALFFDHLPDHSSDQLKDVIDRVARKDLIWEVYEERRSQRRAYSWFVFWTFVLRTFAPAYVIIWNGHHVPEAALSEACEIEGIRKLFAERGPLAGTFLWDPSGVNCLSTFFTAYEKFEIPRKVPLERFVRAYLSSGVSNWGQPERVTREEFYQTYGIPGNKTVLFFPAQVDQDINSKLFSPHFSSTADALSAIIEWCNENSDSVFLVVKGHPKQQGGQELPKLSPETGQYIEGAHIFDCIQYCDGIISINSSSAIEGALLGKPIMLLGHSLLSRCEAVHKLETRSDTPLALSKFVEAIRKNYAYDSRDFFKKLIFGYLYSAKKAFLSLGVPPPILPLCPERPPVAGEMSQLLFQQKISSLLLLFPDARNSSFNKIVRKLRKLTTIGR